MEPTGNSTVSSDRKPIKKTVASSTTAKPNGKSTTSSAIVMKPNEKTDVSSANPMNPNAITALPSAHGDQVMLFRDVSLGPREAELMFRLIHFWEARNPKIKILIGQEMLLIDEEKVFILIDNLILLQGTVIQGFVPAGRVGTYKLIAGSVYKLSNFFGSRSKVQYRVADHSATVSFTWNSALNVLENPPVLIPEDRFRFHSYEEFKANCDSKDYVGHMKLVNGQTVTEHTVLDEIDIAEKRHLCVHVQTHDEPVMKLYLWDKAATDFCQKFKLYGSTPSVLLVTTVNPKHLGGTLALTTMSSSRVFMDADVQLSKDYLEWLSSNSEIANKIAAEVVTKPEPVTLEELFSYIRREAFKVAWFECTAIIDDVVQGSAWYYISCGGCNSKAVKGHTSLICNNKKCVIREVTGVAQYLTRISVYDKSEQAVLSFLTNEGVGVDACVSVPQALLDTIGQTHKFIVKVSDHNLTGKTQTITVTKILPPEVPFQHHLMVFRRLGVINLALKMLLLIGLQKPLRFLSQTKPSVPRVANMASDYPPVQ
uniref:Replication factor A C-terminal domain-containing protein n=1 Tax=Brassica oleracea var. oleracea TaxID=109376 RepID=A0A0D3DQ12_BRAOL